jgi:tRNA(Ile)-lysidine synthase TilS/MesJ
MDENMTTRQMLSSLRKGISQYKLINDGDKIAVGVSGGKDSVTLLKLLAEYKRFSPEKFDLVAISVDLNFENNKTDFAPIQDLCDSLGVDYFIEKTDIGKIVFDIRKETNPCALCSKMRKGALNNLAKEKGCNKVALGHHADDAVDTMLLSLLYEGRLSTFAPKTYLNKIDLTLIRPLIMTREINIIGYSKTLPVVKSCCPANKLTKREHVKTLISNICETIPSARDMMFTALIHPERYNLFDKFERDAIEID